MVTLRQLECFVAVAEELHFGRAAARLRMTQPPLSRQISCLEEELGCELIDRSRRRVRLTSVGTAFLAGARRTLDEAVKSAQMAREVARGQGPVLRVGYIGPAAGEIVPEALRRFRTLSPHVSVSVREGTTPEHVELVRKGTLDVAFVRGPVIARGLHAETILQQSLVAVLPSGHPHEDRHVVTAEMLADDDFVSFPRRAAPGIHDAFLTWCRDAGFMPNVVAEVLSWTSIVNLVAAGFGVSVLADAVCVFSRQGVVYRPLAGPATTVDLALVRQAAGSSAPLHRFLKVVADLR